MANTIQLRNSVVKDKTFPAGVGETSTQLQGGVPQETKMDVPAAAKPLPEGAATKPASPELVGVDVEADTEKPKPKRRRRGK